MIIGIYEKAINSNFDWSQKIDIAKSAGFDFIEFSIDESDEKLARLDWDDKTINDLKQLLIKKNFYFNSVTISGQRKFPFGSTDPKIRKKAYEIIEKGIILAKKLGARNIQLAGYDVYYEDSSPETVKFFEEGIRYASDLAMKHSVMLSFEVMDTEFMGTVKKAMYWVNKIKSPWLNVYPDCGNLYQFAKKGTFADEIKAGKFNIIAAHFKDTKPNVFRDTPFGSGTVDFKEVFRAFAQINYKGPWLIEMWSSNDPSETPEENIELIKNALKFFHNQRKGII